MFDWEAGWKAPKIVNQKTLFCPGSAQYTHLIAHPLSIPLPPPPGEGGRITNLCFSCPAPVSGPSAALSVRHASLPDAVGILPALPPGMGLPPPVAPTAVLLRVGYHPVPTAGGVPKGCMSVVGSRLYGHINILIFYCYTTVLLTNTLTTSPSHSSIHFLLQTYF